MVGKDLILLGPKGLAGLTMNDISRASVTGKRARIAQVGTDNISVANVRLALTAAINANFEHTASTPVACPTGAGPGRLGIQNKAVD